MEMKLADRVRKLELANAEVQFFFLFLICLFNFCFASCDYLSYNNYSSLKCIKIMCFWLKFILYDLETASVSQC